ncbi:hypothetical protein GK047_15525 [Paenibacillus sp. SYP-B3998]|uniref:Uncharacterized protein n=1 Tax=Paenibacillus sp. SYP-B3998 TaxID=2678564 RepID=A0A6G4A0F4_9BACL|nr:hypothetical protein [Paenibacillus sp. SYP-B3998]NEW07414.1 hypothetical protein [Paenibacillus sp. SYP-B3998]
MPIAIATQFYGFGWFPDGTYAAFAVYCKEKDGMNGVYVANAKTDKIDQLGDFQDVSHIAWITPGSFSALPL